MIFLSLGSNQGDLTENLQSARTLLLDSGIAIVAASSELTTKAWGIENQPDFLNQVLLVDFTDGFPEEKNPHTLLYVCQSVEKKMGKKMCEETGYVKWGPRIIDIDILQYDDSRYDEAHLTLPHHTMGKDYIVKLIQEVIAKKGYLLS